MGRFVVVISVNTALPLVSRSVRNSCQLDRSVEPSTETCAAPGQTNPNWTLPSGSRMAEPGTIAGGSMMLKLAALEASNAALVVLLC